MDWKKIRRAICGAAAAVAVCFTAAGMNTKPVYAADMGAVYGIFEHGVGWSAYHGDQTAERAGNGTYVTAIRASLSGQPEGVSGTLSYQVNLSGSGWLPGRKIWRRPERSRRGCRSRRSGWSSQGS